MVMMMMICMLIMLTFAVISGVIETNCVAVNMSAKPVLVAVDVNRRMTNDVDV